LLRPLRLINACRNGAVGYAHDVATSVKRWKSRVFFGNTVDYAANRSGERSWKEARQAYSGPLDRAAHAAFMRDGYRVFDGLLDLPLLERIRGHHCELIGDPEHSYDPYADPKTFEAYNHGRYTGPLPEARRNLKDTSRPLPEIVQLFDDRVVQNVRDCIGANFTLEGAWMWRNTWYPHELIDVFEAHGNRWHFDDQSPDLVHAFIFLQDITEKDGPFQCFDRPYSRYLLSRGFDKEKRRVSVTGGLEDRYFEGSHLKLHTGAFGTMVLCATSFCLHRAGILATGHHRDMLSVTIKPAAEMGLRIP
jgi:hypothetical protein